MRQLLNRLTTGLHMAAFAVVCLAASPFILLLFGVSAVRDLIEARWPDSEQARVASFWLGLLTPIVLIVVASVALGFAIAHVQVLRHSR